ncbi:MAG: MBL fold metallo-hydrolase [Pseudomonadota bacterium]
MTELKFRTDIDFEYAVPREVTTGVTRIVANNPSVFTFKGTNTYILGEGNDLALIDPGPEDDAHFSAIMAFIGDRQLSHILITHTHRDHIDGLERVANATGAKVCGYGRTAFDGDALSASPSGAEAYELAFTPDQKLVDGDEVSGSDWAVKALFTPGHAPDHLSFELTGRKVMFSGDHVMGWNTSVVAPPEGNMADYLASLEKLLDRKDDVYFPGHGGRIEQPQRFAKAYLVHRRWREQAIMSAIQDGNDNIAKIVAVVYKNLDPRLVRAASLSVQAHVEHLAEQSKVRLEQPVTFDTTITVT